jgi:hypothetical protein
MTNPGSPQSADISAPERKRRPKIRVKPLHEKKCAICREPFVAERSDMIYCSGRCRKRALDQRKMAATTQLFEARIGQLIALLPKDYAKLLADLSGKYDLAIVYDIGLHLADTLQIPHTLPPLEK